MQKDQSVTLLPELVVERQATPAAGDAAEALASGIPRTTEDVRGIRARQSELNSQLRTYDARADALIEEMRAAPTEAREAIAQRLKVVTDRMVAIETELAQTGYQLSHAPPRLMSVTTVQNVAPRPRGLQSDQIAVLSGLAIVLVAAPLALGIARLLWKRAFVRRSPVHDVESTQRLKRMEHAVDAMAIEVERISEGQRFLTQIFARGEGRAEMLASSAEHDVP